MKRRDLEAHLKGHGWTFERAGGNHDIWKRGEQTEAVPRHNEINENVARSIIKRCCGKR